MEIWGGIECTINRVGDRYFNQLAYQGHYERPEDLRLLLDLGIKTLRYPVLWEKHQPRKSPADWGVIAENLLFLKENNIKVIAGLVHHGSGPEYVNIMSPTFEEGLAAYAEQVALNFPWIDHFTPVNEPMTTARFCGLYGLWYPHATDARSFLRILLNECKATILAMESIRKVNPAAKLVQTEDLGKVYSTPLLKYQADFENERCWLGMDLLCGLVNPNHSMYGYLLKNGVSEEELEFFNAHARPPDIMGFNHYITSERYLDERKAQYPQQLHGGNGIDTYADVEAVRVQGLERDGLKKILREAWERYQLPMAVTEAHLYCGREDQLRWLGHIWKAVNELQKEGIELSAVTVWSLFGAYGWDNLLTSPEGNYENGVYDVSSGKPRATALSKMVKALAAEGAYQHPVLTGKGWWETDKRIIYPVAQPLKSPVREAGREPVLIIGGRGTLGNALINACIARDISYIAPSRNDLNLISSEQIEAVIRKFKPWAIINAAGYVQVDAAETESQHCFLSNTTGPVNLAFCCKKYGIKLVTFSSDLVFDGRKKIEYLEADEVNPLNVYGWTKATAENNVLREDQSALVIRTSSFFGSENDFGFLHTLQKEQTLKVAKDVFISPTYLPDLVNRTIDLLIDDEYGIWHLTNDGTVSWFELARDVAIRANLNPSLLIPSLQNELGFHARRPAFSALKSSKGILLPSLEHALDRHFSNKPVS
jgi:dTDP-4-dehydrorhamnose reductase